MKQAMFKQFYFAQKCSLLKPSQFLSVPAFNYKTVPRKIKNHDYLNDLNEYKVKMSTMRKEHIKQYWET